MKKFLNLMFNENRMLIRIQRGSNIWSEVLTMSRAFKITGYLYAGELAGNDPIPEKTLFKVKETGEVGRDLNHDSQKSIVHIQFEDLEKPNFSGTVHDIRAFDKSEIEPYFE